LSPKRVACLIFAMVGASGQRTWVKGSVALVLASKSCPFISGKSSMTGDGRLTGSLELSAPTSQCGGAVPFPLMRGGPKWRDNFPQESDHPVSPNIWIWRYVAEVVTSSSLYTLLHNVLNTMKGLAWFWLYITITYQTWLNQRS